MSSDNKVVKVKGRKCPECGSEDVQRSQMRGMWERGILRAIGLRAFRCAKCDNRHFGSEDIDEKRGRI